MYDRKLKNYFNEIIRVQPLTTVFQKLKQHMLDNIAKGFQRSTYTTLPTFAWFTREEYYTWGKEYIDKFKVHMFEVDPEFKIAHEKSAQYFEREVISKEFNALTDIQKTEIDDNMNAAVVLDAVSLGIATSEGENRNDNAQKRARAQFFNPYHNNSSSKKMKIGPNLINRSKHAVPSVTLSTEQHE